MELDRPFFNPHAKLNFSSLSATPPLSSPLLLFSQTFTHKSSVFNLSSRLLLLLSLGVDSNILLLTLHPLGSSRSLSFFVCRLIQTARVWPGRSFVACWRGSAVSRLLKSLSCFLPFSFPSFPLPAAEAGSLYFTLRANPLILISWLF